MCWTDCLLRPDSSAQLFAIIDIIATFQLCSDPSEFSNEGRKREKCCELMCDCTACGKRFHQFSGVKVTSGNFKSDGVFYNEPMMSE